MLRNQGGPSGSSFSFGRSPFGPRSVSPGPPVTAQKMAAPTSTTKTAAKRDKETRRQGDKETKKERVARKHSISFSLSPCLPFSVSPHDWPAFFFASASFFS